MMKISKSKFVKSAISILLVVMMLLSAGMSSIIAVTVDMVSESANVELAETGVNISGGTVLYMYPLNSEWHQNNERYAAYFSNQSDNAWASMEEVSGTKFYSVTAPSGTWTEVIFYRMNGGSTENNLNNKWNQTVKLTYDGTNDLFAVTGKDNSGNFTGTWLTYNGEDPFSNVALVGSFNNWNEQAFMMKTDVPNVVSLNLDLEKKDYSFKLKNDGAWKGNSSTIDDTNLGESLDFSEDKGNCTLKAEGGTYIFAFNTSTQKLKVTKATQTSTVTVTINQTVGGTVSGGGTVPDDGTVASGTQVTLTATPEAGYVFTSWNGLPNGVSTTTNPVTFSVTGNINVSANFTSQTTVVPASNFYIHSTFFDPKWSDTVKFQTSDSENIGSLTLTISKGDYQFKITDGSNWYGRNDIITDTTGTSAVVFSTNGGNCTFKATTDGTYTFTLDTSTMKLTVTKDEQTSSTITVYGTNGSISGAGTTSFKEDTVVNQTSQGTYYQASVKPDEYFTINTQIQATGSTYDWYVEGYVINGKEFVEASSMGPGLYSANIRLSAEYDKADIVPIYFHTDEYLARNDIDTITFYAVVPKGINNWTPDNGNSYLSAYTWYYTNDENPQVKYESFGKYPGQLMIPMKGDNNLYYTIVENKAPEKNTDESDIYVSGVTLNNYLNTFPSNENTNNVQTYDFYEFVSYAELQRENITFVLKNHNTDYNKKKVNETSITPANFTFTDFVNYNNEITNIFGEVKDQAWFNDRVNAEKVLHVVRVGNKNYKGETHKCTMTSHPDGTCPLTGEWYVDAYIYGPNGNYITKCHSYQLSNGDMKRVLEPYSDYAVKVSYEKGSVVNIDGADEGNKHDATRWDGEWYADDKNTTVTVNVSVNVAISEDGGETFEIVEDAQNKPGTALVNGSSSVNVTRGEEVSLLAEPKSGYRFIGWANADRQIFSTNVSETVKVAISTSYTAVYQQLATNQFYLNHYLYKGDGTAPDNEIPTAHNGSGDLYVRIENLNNGEDTGLLKQKSVNVQATQGDKLRITIATDPAGINKFYAWYVGAEGPSGTTYEEVGVDSFDNLAMPGNGGTYTNPKTVVGSSDMVYYQFMYEVGTEFNLTLYSDIVRQTANKTLIYTYNDRGMGIKKYYVNIELTPEEIDAGYTPSNDTISKHAPFVGDYYKDIQWVISKFDKESCELWGTNITKYYTVTAVINGKPKVENVPYNTQFTIDASDYGFSKGGFWYQDTDGNLRYDTGVDPIIANGTCYSYVVTKDMVIGYEENNDIDFNVSLDAPVYGREQSTDTSGNNKVDKVVIDYVVNMVTPNVYGDGSGFTPYYKGEPVTDNWSGQMVTIESLKQAGYKVSFGVLLEQVALNYVVDPPEYDDDFATFGDALADAKDHGYGKATVNVDGILKNMIGLKKTTLSMKEPARYYINYDRTDAAKLTNKNRYLFTIELDNTLYNRAAYYNVYAYMIVKAPDQSDATIYISNVQTLNIHTTGTTNVPQPNN